MQRPPSLTSDSKLSQQYARNDMSKHCSVHLSWQLKSLSVKDFSPRYFHITLIYNYTFTMHFVCS